MGDSPAPEGFTLLDLPQGTLDLRRFPDPGPRSPLRAWDAADEYALKRVAELAEAGAGEGVEENGSPTPDRTALVVNDGFGALALGLAVAGFRVVSWSDSVTAREALRRNAERNGLDPAGVTFLSADSDLPANAGFSVALVKIPRELELLEYQLGQIPAALGPDAVVLGAAMAKHLPRSAVETFGTRFGSARSSLAWKKARLVELVADPEAGGSEGPPPALAPEAARFTVAGSLVGGSLSATGLEVVSRPGVFSSGRLDRGTEFLLEEMPETEDEVRVVDLGCGNGILGCAAAARNPEAEVLFTDRSYLAVASAAATWRGAFGPDREAQFLAADSLAGVEDGWADLVLNNPPFHDAHVVGDSIAWRMFLDSRRVLAPGGALYVVGNRHLGYHTKLKRIFGNCAVVASDPTFTVLRAVRD